MYQMGLKLERVIAAHEKLKSEYSVLREKQKMLSNRVVSIGGDVKKLECTKLTLEAQIYGLELAAKNAGEPSDVVVNNAVDTDYVQTLCFAAEEEADAMPDRITPTRRSWRGVLPTFPASSSKRPSSYFPLRCTWLATSPPYDSVSSEPRFFNSTKRAEFGLYFFRSSGLQYNDDVVVIGQVRWLASKQRWIEARSKVWPEDKITGSDIISMYGDC